MEAADFTRKFPKLYHLTFVSNRSSIEKHGLLSAAAVAELYRFTQEERLACIERRRLCNQDLHGVTLRDQHAAPEKKMKSCLVNITIPEWIALLNSKTFFFVDLNKALALAARYGDYPNLLLEVDTAALLAMHSDSITLCKINSGAFIFNARPRGRDSFIPLGNYHFRNKRDTPAELTVDVPIPGILRISRFLPLS